MPLQSKITSLASLGSIFEPAKPENDGKREEGEKYEGKDKAKTIESEKKAAMIKKNKEKNKKNFELIIKFLIN